MHSDTFFSSSSLVLTVNDILSFSVCLCVSLSLAVGEALHNDLRFIFSSVHRIFSPFHLGRRRIINRTVVVLLQQSRFGSNGKTSEEYFDISIHQNSGSVVDRLLQNSSQCSKLFPSRSPSLPELFRGQKRKKSVIWRTRTFLFPH